MTTPESYCELFDNCYGTGPELQCAIQNMGKSDVGAGCKTERHEHLSRRLFYLATSSQFLHPLLLNAKHTV